MNQFELWKLGTDIALVLSLIFLCVRFLKSQAPSINIRELRDLEIMLRTLIKDADVAGRALSDSLGRRQSALEGLLNDLDSAERRANTSIRTQPTGRVTFTPSYDEPQYSQAAPAKSDEAEQIAAPRRTGAAAYAQNQAKTPTNQKPAKPTKQKVNIFGEPIGGEQNMSAVQTRMPKQPLADKIEIEREEDMFIPPKETPKEPLADLDAVYEAAEQLLRSGKKLEAVANETSLPMDEVRALSQMMLRQEQVKASAPVQNKMPTGNMEVFKPQKISINTEAPSENTQPQAEQSGTEEQQKLGALSTMRREIQVL